MENTVRESNPLNPDIHPSPGNRFVDWNYKGIRIYRLRLLSDPGFPVWDVSYCWGKLPDGELVNVTLPFDQLPKQRVSRTIVEYARKDGVYAKGTGILDAISTLI